MLTKEQKQVLRDNHPFYIMLDERTERRRLRKRLAADLGLTDRQVITFMYDIGRRQRLHGQGPDAAAERRRPRRACKHSKRSGEGCGSGGGSSGSSGSSSDYCDDPIEALPCEFFVSVEDILGPRDDEFMDQLDALFPATAPACDSLFETA